jgi:hypothetical protein
LRTDSFADNRLGWHENWMNFTSIRTFARSDRETEMRRKTTRARTSKVWLTTGLVFWIAAAPLISANVRAAILPPAPDNLVPAAGRFSIQPEANTHVMNLYATGVQAYQDGDMKNAIHWWRQAALEGHLMSQYNLGSAYASGAGVPLDMAEAAHWWRLAAQQGSTDAQYNLGVIYYEGKGVARNVADASMWWYLAAMGGDAAAQFRLGHLAASGENGEISIIDAEWWWQRSAAQGFDAAAQALKRLRAGEVRPVNQNK